MIERRDAVLAADKAGDQMQLERRLYDLQRYVAAHMNASPGQVPLENTYKVVYDRELERFEQSVASDSGNDVVAKVRDVCDTRAKEGGYGRFQANADPRYVACINEEWEKYPAASAISTEFIPPSTAPYYQTFASPLWSPDFAGWAIAACGVIAVVIAARLIMLGVLRLMLARQYDRF